MESTKTITNQQFDCLRILDQRLQAGSEGKTFYINQGASDSTTSTYNANTFSSSTLSFSGTTNGPTNFMSRIMTIDYTIRLEDTNLIEGQAPIDPLLEGPRFMPLTSSSNNVGLTLNGRAFSWQPDTILNGIMWGYESNDNNIMTTCPFVQDQSFVYGSNNNDMKDKARNVFADYANQGLNDPMSRNGFNYSMKVIPAVGTTGNIVEISISEPVLISPLMIGKDDIPALYGVNNFSLNYTFNAARFWSSNIADQVVLSAAGAGAPDATTRYSIRNMVPGKPNFFVGTPRLTVTYLSAPDTIKLPSTMSWSLHDIVTNSKLSDVINAGPSGVEVQSGNINLTSISSKVYIFATPTKLGIQDRYNNIPGTVTTGTTYEPLDICCGPFTSCGYTDSFALIESLSVTFHNRSGLLSNCTIADLHKISVNNGLKMSFAQFSAGAYTGSGFHFQDVATNTVPIERRVGPGSVVILDPSRDLSLNSSFANGSLGNFPLSVKAKLINPMVASTFGTPLKNITANINTAYDLYVVTISDGILSYDSISGQFLQEVGVISSEQVLSAPVATDNIHYLMNKNMYGGSVFSSLRSLGNKILGYAGPITRGISNVSAMIPHPISQGISGVTGQIGDALKSRGYGRGGKRVNKNNLLE